jgi:hypothetical protein
MSGRVFVPAQKMTETMIQTESEGRYYTAHQFIGGDLRPDNILFGVRQDGTFYALKTLKSVFPHSL